LPEDVEGEAKLEEARAEMKIMKCIAIRCPESKAIFAHNVPVKGRDEDNYVAGLTAADVQFLGHVKVILKTDNEPALLALATAALLNIRIDAQKDESPVRSVSIEHSAEHESQSNGGTECGIRAVRCQFRTLKLCLEERIGQKIPPTHPLSAWLVEHPALLLNAKAAGEDGKTAWARLRGRDCGQKLLGFSEAVMYKQPPKGPQHDIEGNMGARMFPGTMLGYSRLSNTYLVATEEGAVIRIRSDLRRPEVDRWNMEKAKGIVATPWSLRASSAPAAMELGQPVAKDPVAPERAVPLPRRFKITMKILEEFGTTDGCPQCMHIRSFGETKAGIAHTEACRKRIVEQMKSTGSRGRSFEPTGHWPSESKQLIKPVVHILGTPALWAGEIALPNSSRRSSTRTERGESHRSPDFPGLGATELEHRCEMKVTPLARYRQLDVRPPCIGETAHVARSSKVREG